MGANDADEEITIVNDLSSRKIEELQSVFAIADPQNLQRRVGPGARMA